MRRALLFGIRTVCQPDGAKRRALIQLQEFISVESEVTFLSIHSWDASGPMTIFGFNLIALRMEYNVYSLS